MGVIFNLIIVPGKPKFMHIQVASLGKHDYADDLITARCVTQGELDAEIDYMIKELENIRNRAKEQWGLLQDSLVVI